MSNEALRLREIINKIKDVPKRMEVTIFQGSPVEMDLISNSTKPAIERPVPIAWDKELIISSPNV